MATGTERHAHNKAEGTETAVGSKPKHQKRHWRWLVVVVALAAIIWFLPAIVVHTPILNWAIGKAAADLNGTVTVGSASLGWLSPIEVDGVEVKDTAGKSVLVLPAATSEKTLAGILCNYTSLGQFTLKNPKVSIVLRDDGSNIEDVLAKYLAPKEPSPPMKIGLSLKVVNAGIAITEQITNNGWRVEKLGVDFSMPAGTAGPMAVSVSADLPDERRPGTLTAGVKIGAEANEVTLGAKQFPLAMFRSLAARLMPGTSLSGWLSSDVRVSWGGTAGKNTVGADLSVESLSLGTPAIANDVIGLDRLHVASQVSWQADRLDIQQAVVDCDLGNISGQSSVQLGEKGGFSLNSLMHQRHQISGQLDLARLARLLPATLRLRQQLQINSGQLKLSFSSQPGPQGTSWDGQLDAANLTATSAGRQIAWRGRCRCC